MTTKAEIKDLIADEARVSAERAAEVDFSAYGTDAHEEYLIRCENEERAFEYEPSDDRADEGDSQETLDYEAEENHRAWLLEDAAAAIVAPPRDPADAVDPDADIPF